MTRSVSLILGLALVMARSAQASIISSDPNLPSLYPPAAYKWSSLEPAFPAAQFSFDHLEDHASGPVSRVPSGSTEEEAYSSQLSGLVSVNGGPYVSMVASGSEQAWVYNKIGLTTGTFNTELVAMNLSGSSSYGSFLLRESPSLASKGQTTVTGLGGGLYQIDSFFDVYTELSLDGGQNWYPSSGAARVTLESVPEVFSLGLLAAGILSLGGVRWLLRGPEN
jgi:hypothetical protein